LGVSKQGLNDTEPSLAFVERMGDKKLFLFVDVENKPREVFCSYVTEAATSNVGLDNVIGPIDSSKEAFVSHAIDWDNPEIIPLGLLDKIKLVVYFVCWMKMQCMSLLASGQRMRGLSKLEGG